MNYRHAYHAGNFADVMKHIVLIALLDAMKHKPTPFCYIDTHAGSGYYDLSSTETQKTKEYLGGIEKVIKAANPPPLIKRYLHCIHEINERLTQSEHAGLHYYPGSPTITRSLLRSVDKMVVCDLEPQAYQQLKAMFNTDKQVAVHHIDGYLSLKAFLPPVQRRGVILIDPPYESPDEWARLAHTLPFTLKRFETGVFAIWYPIKENRQVAQFQRTLKKEIHRPILDITLTIHPDMPNHLNGCGMIIINPPWQLDEHLKPMCTWLWNVLTINKQGGYSANLLK